jgi:dihydrolipoyl dehydrogenase
VRSVFGAEFPIHSGVKLQVARDRDVAYLSWSGSSCGARSFDRVLVATGRPPQLQDLNLASTGVSMDERGVPHFDGATLQCGDAPIFLAGDVDGQRPVLHEAAAEGTIAGRNAAAFPNLERAKRAVPLSIMFTDPPLATIGAPPSDSTIVGTGSYADQGRARIDACNSGLVRIYANRETGAITGAVLLGPAMDHIAHLFAWAIERGETAARMLELPLYHPTFEEGLAPPLRQICESVGTDIAHLDSLAPPGA